jgi:hypothetical protein
LKEKKTGYGTDTGPNSIVLLDRPLPVFPRLASTAAPDLSGATETRDRWMERSGPRAVSDGVAPLARPARKRLPRERSRFLLRYRGVMMQAAENEDMDETGIE